MSDLSKFRRTLVALFAIALLGACSSQEDAAPAAPAGPRPTQITAVQAEAREVSEMVRTVGDIASKHLPTVAAEVAGRVLRVAADTGDRMERGQVLAELDTSELRLTHRAKQAEVRSLEAQIVNQQHIVDRYRNTSEFVSQTLLEEAEVALTSLKARLDAAHAQAALAARSLEKARIVAPVAGRVERRFVSEGDFLERGNPAFVIADDNVLRVRLPFPETFAHRLRTGLEVQMMTPAAPGMPAVAQVTEVRPVVGATNRAVELVVELDNPGGWRPGASVTAQVIVEKRPDAVLVPQYSVVRRPAGQVVYVIEDGIARQRIVETGQRIDGMVEIRSGLAAGERIAYDGAGYLSDQAPVAVREEL